MHVKSLKVFCDIAGRRSFSRAAAANGISQSGASQMVHQLEQRLGVRLIDRSKRPFVLTDEGEVFYRGCRKLVQDYATLEEEVRTLHEEVEGRVRVACIYSVGLSHMNRCVQQFLTHHPKANVHVEYQHPDEVYELVQRDQVDLGLVSYAASTRSIKAIPWRQEPMVLACAPGNPLADRGSIDLSELDGVRMIGFDEGLRIRQAIDRALGARGVEVRYVMEFDNTETIKRAIEIDAGVGILPEPTIVRETQAGTLVSVGLAATSPLPGSGPGGSDRWPEGSGPVPLLNRPLGIIVRRGKRFGATARRFFRALQEESAAPPSSDSSARWVESAGAADISTEAETVR